MDDPTAGAFAAHAFEKRHPRETWPEWLRRCTVMSYGKDRQHRIVVSMSVTPKATNNAVCYFEATVDPFTAETIVNIDEDFSKFLGEELQGF